jgi:hypothetical protein
MKLVEPTGLNRKSGVWGTHWSLAGRNPKNSAHEFLFLISHPPALPTHGGMKRVCFLSETDDLPSGSKRLLLADPVEPLSVFRSPQSLLGLAVVGLTTEHLVVLPDRGIVLTPILLVSARLR